MYTLLSSTNAALPLESWDSMGSRSVSARGSNNINFIVTNAFDFGQRYYILRFDN
jgi:hypothetical protein